MTIRSIFLALFLCSCGWDPTPPVGVPGRDYWHNYPNVCRSVHFVDGGAVECVEDQICTANLSADAGGSSVAWGCYWIHPS